MKSIDWASLGGELEFYCYNFYAFSSEADRNRARHISPSACQDQL